ncbi:hypothetical protein TNIN_79301 [Trichonephila inaurata madagascariensis]|uniref:Uncharacterized protein n=1 Tax=Trichonephila inaurata madagascariensis TaxID=2747483 RepID=A0A8X6YY55_9ARAC|nr:hypothetical protein TNIN_79301 [Trichonephila inaurata madagascariensis]
MGLCLDNEIELPIYTLLVIRGFLCAVEALAIFEELPLDDYSAASNNSDTDDEDYVENVAQGENTSSDDEEINEMQCPSTSQPEVKWGKQY